MSRTEQAQMQILNLIPYLCIKQWGSKSAWGFWQNRQCLLQSMAGMECNMFQVCKQNIAVNGPSWRLRPILLQEGSSCLNALRPNHCCIWDDGKLMTGFEPFN